MNHRSLNILKTVLEQFVCYISYKRDGFVFEKPYTTNVDLCDRNKQYHIENTYDDGKIRVINIFNGKLETLDVVEILNFKYKSNNENSLKSIGTFKENLLAFKKSHIEYMTDEFLNEIIFIQRCNLNDPSESIYKKDLFLSVNLHMIKFMDFLKISTISEISELITNDSKMLRRLKDRWIVEIEKSKTSALKFIADQLREAKQSESEDSKHLITSLKEMKSIVNKYDYVSEIENIKSIDRVLHTWPSIFLPAPDFVNKLDKNFNYSKL